MSTKEEMLISCF